MKNDVSVLRIGTPNIVKTANVFSDYYLGIFGLVSNMPLVSMDSDEKFSGLVAESYEVSGDYTEWVFKIRDDLFWSDGKKVLPEDVVFSINMTAEHNPDSMWLRNVLQSARIEDGNRVVFSFNKTVTNIDLEFNALNIFPKHIWEKIENPLYSSNTGVSHGCGPFYIEKIDLNTRIIFLSRNPYWTGKRPGIDRIEIHMFNNIDVLLMALEKREVDTFFYYANSFPYYGVEKLERTQQFDFEKHLSSGLIYLGFNMNRPPLSDVRFREAVTYALNYTEMIEIDALGNGEIPNRGFVPPVSKLYTPTEKLQFDPVKSGKILSEAGYRDTDGDGFLEDLDGNEIDLTILIRQNYSRLAQLVYDYLTEIGIKLKVKTVDHAAWISMKDNFGYDITISRTTPWGMRMYAGAGTGYFDSRRTGAGVLHTIEDKEFLSICDTMLSAGDEEDLIENAARIQEYYAENIPAVPLYWHYKVTPLSRNITGWSAVPLYGYHNVKCLVNIEKTESY